MTPSAPLSIPSFAAYAEDRKYLRNVTPKTLGWFANAWKAFGPHIEPALKSQASAVEGRRIAEGLRTGITALLAKGVRPVSVNSYLTCIRAYLNWLHAEGYLLEAPKVHLLKYEQKVIATFSPEQVQRIVGFRPKGANRARAQVASCLMLDAGLRLSEVLQLRSKDIDFDNLLVTVMGKGRKERRVPISKEMRGLLFRHCRVRRESTGCEAALVFGTRNGTCVTSRNFERDFKYLCTCLQINGVRCSPHTLRHTFAVNYLRAGGNLFYLSRILGHTSVKITERYLQSVGVEDLSAVHGRLSPLSRR